MKPNGGPCHAPAAHTHAHAHTRTRPRARAHAHPPILQEALLRQKDEALAAQLAQLTVGRDSSTCGRKGKRSAWEEEGDGGYQGYSGGRRRAESADFDVGEGAVVYRSLNVGMFETTDEDDANGAVATPKLKQQLRLLSDMKLLLEDKSRWVGSAGEAVAALQGIDRRLLDLN